MLENNELSKSSSMSYAEFENAKKQRIINAIQNFAIPTTKSDLFEFITSLQAKTKGTYRKAYKNKLEECLLKAQALFPNDKLFVGLIEENKKRKVEKAKKLIYAIGIPVLFAALVVLFFILKPTPTHKSLEKTTIAVDKALKEGDTQKAMTIFFEYKGKGRYRQPERDLAENGTAQSIIDACLADGNLRDAIRIGNAAGMDYGEWDGYEKAMASTIYDYCISHGDFETAKSIYSTANCEFHYHGEYIKDVVTYLCEHGKKDEAQKFLNNNIDKVTSYDHLYESGNGDPKHYVKNIIQKIINHY